jgi:hypothetical protein
MFSALKSFMDGMLSHCNCSDFCVHDFRVKRRKLVPGVRCVMQWTFYRILSEERERKRYLEYVDSDGLLLLKWSLR